MYLTRLFKPFSKNNNHLWITPILMITSILASCMAENKNQTPVLRDGILDLTNWSFAKDGPVPMKGEWRFVWKKLTDPAPIDQLRKEHPNTIRVPEYWSANTTNDDTSNNASGVDGITGYGTYFAEIKLNPKTTRIGQKLAIQFHNINSAGTVMIWDQDHNQLKNKASFGKPAVQPSEEVPLFMNGVEEITLSTTDTIYVLIRISNHINLYGGLGITPVVGTKEVLQSQWFQKFLTSAILVGALLIIGIYHLILYFQQLEDKSSLAFAFFCLSVAIYQSVISDFTAHLGIGISADGFANQITVQFMIMPMIQGSLAVFIYYMLPGKLFGHLIKYWFLGFGGGLCMLPLFGNIKALVELPFLETMYHQALLLGGLFILVHLGIKIYQKDKTALWISLAFAIVFAGLINDILIAQGVIDSIGIAAYCVLTFVLLQSAIISNKAAMAFRQAKHLSKNLTKEVKQQTGQLEAEKEKAVAAHLESDTLRLKAEAAKEEVEQAHKETLMAKDQVEQAHKQTKDLQKKAEEQAEQLQELDKQKTSFFQNMSHELRTPLTLILNPLEHQLKAQPDNEELGMAAKNARRLLRLVNQLLDFQKLQSGKQGLKKSPLDLAALTLISGRYFNSPCVHKDITFKISIDGEELTEDHHHLWVMGEVDAIEKMIFNYLSNALKHTPAGGNIELGLTSENNKVRLFVNDTGSGIDKDQQNKLFQVFTQLDQSTTRAHEGTGLGLALVKSLADEINAQVGVESSLGQGSSFWLEFEQLTISQAPVKVLIVEDHQDLGKQLLDLIQEDLDLEDNEIYTMTTAEEALTFLANHEISCVVSDYKLPGKNGLDLMNEVAKLYPEAYRILITVEASFEVLERAVNEKLVHQVFHKTADPSDFIESLIETVAEHSCHESEEQNYDTHTLDENFMIKPWLLADGEDTIESQSPKNQTAANSDTKILIVDDLADMRRLIISTLSPNYHIITAANGEEGLQTVLTQQPDLIITDWMMPQLSGPDLIKALKNDPHSASIPVILLTAKSDEESKLIGTDLGADAFLGKPFNDQELNSVVRNLLALKSQEKELKQLNEYITDGVMKRYLPPTVIDQILSGKLSMDKPAQMQRITILFSDIDGFTRASEEIGPEKIADFLNSYLSKMNEVIFNFGGTIDKFMGDAIMVMFGAPGAMSDKDQARKAVNCALAMQEAMTGITTAMKQENQVNLKMRIGIHQGEAVVGNFGSNQRKDYTAIGPNVNLASRIESCCEPGEVFVSKEVSTLLDEHAAEQVGVFELKGIPAGKPLFRIAS